MYPSTSFREFFKNTRLSNMINYKRKGKIKEIKHAKTEENKGDEIILYASIVMNYNF